MARHRRWPAELAESVVASGWVVPRAVVRAVQAHPGAQYLVTAGEDVVGVLHVADLAGVLEPQRAARRTRTR